MNTEIEFKGAEMRKYNPVIQQKSQLSGNRSIKLILREPSWRVEINRDNTGVVLNSWNAVLQCLLSFVVELEIETVKEDSQSGFEEPVQSSGRRFMSSLWE